ncbi:hypothetical protein ABZZ36_33485 [Actinacidiphila glaucinigra]|uniref:hypothetical protein n=1 Tax=Actinacidiphila glaucinigra TaxID=235986 RepID=UPI0033A65113
MPEIKIDYDVLNDAKQRLEALAGEIDPLIKKGIFGRLSSGYGEAQAVLGHEAVATAMSTFHTNATSTMGRADKGIKELAAAFGSVGEAFREFDSELGAQIGVMSANLHVQNWKQQKAQWEYKQQHLKECEGPGELPDFCSATDPGDTPPDFHLDTNRGHIDSHVEVDADGNVTKEVTTVEYDGKKYTSTTTYTGPSYTTDTTYPDGSTAHTVANINGDGSGTMTVTNSDGGHTEYTRGPKGSDGKTPEWSYSGGDKPGGDPDDPKNPNNPDTHPQNPGTHGGTNPKIA